MRFYDDVAVIFNIKGNLRTTVFNDKGQAERTTVLKASDLLKLTHVSNNSIDSFE